MKAPEFKWGIEVEKHNGFALGIVFVAEKINGERTAHISLILGWVTIVAGRYMY